MMNFLLNKVVLTDIFGVIGDVKKKRKKKREQNKEKKKEIILPIILLS